MNAMQVLTQFGIHTPELEHMINNALDAKRSSAPVVPDPIKIEEDQWLEPMGQCATIILRDSL